MSHEEFFNWLRSMQDDKRLSQNEVDTANELLQTTTPEQLKAWLIEVNDWNIEEPKTGFMQLSKAGVDYIKKFEAYRAKPYQDSKGVWTIGYGNTYYPNGKRVSPNDKPITEAEASELKRTITNRDFVPSVNIMLRDEIKAGKITQNMFDALVSLAYNIGTGALAASTVIRKLKAGDINGAADAFRRFNISGGKVLKGLINRREEERKIFLS